MSSILFLVTVHKQTCIKYKTESVQKLFKHFSLEELKGPSESKQPAASFSPSSFVWANRVKSTKWKL